jgi:hypothetical protein
MIPTKITSANTARKDIKKVKTTVAVEFEDIGRWSGDGQETKSRTAVNHIWVIMISLGDPLIFLDLMLGAIVDGEPEDVVGVVVGDEEKEVIYRRVITVTAHDTIPGARGDTRRVGLTLTQLIYSTALLTS